MKNSLSSVHLISVHKGFDYISVSYPELSSCVINQGSNQQYEAHKAGR